MTGQRIQQEAICYQWFKQRLILSVSEPSISQWTLKWYHDFAMQNRRYKLKLFVAFRSGVIITRRAETELTS